MLPEESPRKKGEVDHSFMTLKLLRRTLYSARNFGSEFVTDRKLTKIRQCLTLGKQDEYERKCSQGSDGTSMTQL